jgi:hypothetical protein
MSFAISPRFTDSKLSSGAIEDMIDVYEDQVFGWLIEPTKFMGASQHAGFAMLAVVLTYFEPLGQFLEGRAGSSGAQFIKGMKAVFPGIDPNVPAVVFGELYNQLRCGMFHRGLTKSKVAVVRGNQMPIVVVHAANGEVQSITVDPWLLLEAIANHHSIYIAQLRNLHERTLRKNFNAWFTSRAA